MSNDCKACDRCVKVTNCTGFIGPRGVTYTPHTENDGEHVWLILTNDGGLPTPDPVDVKGEIGPQGLQGITFTPVITSSGDDVYLGWTNDGGMPNPNPVNIRGPKGLTGDQGPQGVKGDKGDRGDIGPQGEQGPKGVQGLQGEQGPEGKQGAEGPLGPQGVEGPAGPAGPAGKNGEDGRSFTINGMYDTMATLVAAHPTGQPGEAYAVGTTGSNTIYIWGDTDEWVELGALQGPAGPQGEPGPQGIQGKQGIQGEQGLQGPQGVKGDSGAKGDTGDKGAKGDTGPQGTTGAQGPKGDTGATGATGPAGATGAAGQGVPTGGTAGQVLTKSSGTNYDTAWTAQAAGVSLTASNTFTGVNTFNPAVTTKAVFGTTTNLNVTASSSFGLGRTAAPSNSAAGVTAIGSGALETTTTGANNTAVGANALAANTAGTYNSALGHAALFCVTGSNSYNTGVGAAAMSPLATGANNTAVGYTAGQSMSSGPLTIASNCTYIGAKTSAYNESMSNETVIGYGALGGGSNTVTLGNTSITKLICKQTAITALSDERTKVYHEPADDGKCRDTVLALPVSRYQYEDFTGTNIDRNVTGFMADDVEKVFPKSVSASDRWFPVLDEDGEQVYETVVDEDGNERQEPKMFLMEGVKDITMTEALPTLWGAVRHLIVEVEALKAKASLTAKDIEAAEKGAGKLAEALIAGMEDKVEAAIAARE